MGRRRYELLIGVGGRERNCILPYCDKNVLHDPLGSTSHREAFIRLAATKKKNLNLICQIM